MGRRRTPVQRELDPVRWARPVEGAFAGIITGQVLRTLPLRTPRPTCGVLADGWAPGIDCRRFDPNRLTVGRMADEIFEHPRIIALCASSN